MRAYTLSGPSASGTAAKTAVAVIGSASVRVAVNDVVLGNSQAPADYGILAAVTRFTAVGTSAASPPTPNPVDPDDVAAVATTGWTHSAEPTYATVDLFQFPMNARATYRHFCMPGYEWKAPATANNGIGVRLVTASTALILNATVQWIE